MPRNDASDSKSVRSPDDPRRSVKALQQETELALGASEAHDTGGVEHQSREDREGIPAARRPVEAATRHMRQASDAQGDARDAPTPPAGERR